MIDTNAGIPYLLTLLTQLEAEVTKAIQIITGVNQFGPYLLIRNNHINMPQLSQNWFDGAKCLKWTRAPRALGQFWPSSVMLWHAYRVCSISSIRIPFIYIPGGNHTMEYVALCGFRSDMSQWTVGFGYWLLYGFVLAWLVNKNNPVRRRNPQWPITEHGTQYHHTTQIMSAHP